MEDLEDVVLESDGEKGVVGEDLGHSGVEEREEGDHGRDVRHPLLLLLEPVPTYHVRGTIHYNCHHTNMDLLCLILEECNAFLESEVSSSIFACVFEYIVTAAVCFL